MEEVWKEINGYDNYLVSNFGNIKSIKRNLILKQYTLKNGYQSITLCQLGEKRTLSIHRLVCQSFLLNPENKEQVNHIDGNKLNNNITNLEWCTHSENQLHSIKSGLRTTNGIKNSQSKLTEESVLKILNDKRLYKEISIEYNISIPTISDIKRGYSWTHITGLSNKKKR